MRVGSCPWSWAKIFTKTGTMNINIAVRTSVAKMNTIVG